jgi:hypothetical protein
MTWKSYSFLLAYVNAKVVLTKKLVHKCLYKQVNWYTSKTLKNKNVLEQVNKWKYYSETKKEWSLVYSTWANHECNLLSERRKTPELMFYNDSVCMTLYKRSNYRYEIFVTRTWRWMEHSVIWGWWWNGSVCNYEGG